MANFWTPTLSWQLVITPKKPLLCVCRQVFFVDSLYQIYTNISAEIVVHDMFGWLKETCFTSIVYLVFTIFSCFFLVVKYGWTQYGFLINEGLSWIQKELLFSFISLLQSNYKTLQSYLKFLKPLNLLWRYIHLISMSLKCIFWVLETVGGINLNACLNSKSLKKSENIQPSCHVLCCPRE